MVTANNQDANGLDDSTPQSEDATRSQVSTSMRLEIYPTPPASEQPNQTQQQSGEASQVGPHLPPERDQQPLPQGFPDVSIDDSASNTEETGTDNTSVDTSMARRDRNNWLEESVYQDSETGQWYRGYRSSDRSWKVEKLQSAEWIEGGYRFKDSNGTEVTQWKTGARDTVTRDGNITKLDSNSELWYHERQAPGGGRERFIRQGDQWQRQVGDQVEKVDKILLPPDDTVVYFKENNRIIVEEMPDGTRETSTANLDGTVLQRTDKADGLPFRFESVSTSGYEELEHDGNGWQLIKYDGSKQYVDLETTADGGYRYRTADGTIVTQGADGTRVTDKSGAAENKRLDDLSEQYGVKHTTTMSADGTVTHRYFVEGGLGNKIPILENCIDSYENVEAHLKKAQEELIAGIEDRYKVKISRDGERGKNPSTNYELRTPRLDELYGLQSALEKSQPSNLLSAERTAKGERLLVEFNKNDEVKNWAGEYDATYGPLVAFDGLSADSYEGRPGASRFQAVEGAMMHQIAHNGQFQRNAQISGYWENLAESMGFEPKIPRYMHFDGSRSDLWIIKGKESDERYAYLKNTRDPKSRSAAWYRVDERGRPLGEDGQPVDVTDAKQIPPDQVARNALVTPATDNFTDPSENGAEAAKLLRRGSDYRTQLFNRNPDLYELAKKYDQYEINRAYGVKSDGSPNYVRGLDGRLIENTEQNSDRIRQITDWESELHRRRRAA